MDEKVSIRKFRYQAGFTPESMSVLAENDVLKGPKIIKIIFLLKIPAFQ